MTRLSFVRGLHQTTSRAFLYIFSRSQYVVFVHVSGIPVALLLMQRNATVTIAHSRTADIEGTVRRADIVVAAVGRAEMVKKVPLALCHSHRHSHRCADIRMSLYS